MENLKRTSTAQVSIAPLVPKVKLKNGSVVNIIKESHAWQPMFGAGPSAALSIVLYPATTISMSVH